MDSEGGISLDPRVAGCISTEMIYLCTSGASRFFVEPGGDSTHMLRATSKGFIVPCNFDFAEACEHNDLMKKRSWPTLRVK